MCDVTLVKYNEKIVRIPKEYYTKGVKLWEVSSKLSKWVFPIEYLMTDPNYDEYAYCKVGDMSSAFIEAVKGYPSIRWIISCKQLTDQQKK